MLAAEARHSASDREKSGHFVSPVGPDLKNQGLGRFGPR
jgi:hypothetical protein